MGVFGCSSIRGVCNADIGCGAKTLRWASVQECQPAVLGVPHAEELRAWIQSDQERRVRMRYLLRRVADSIEALGDVQVQDPPVRHAANPNDG
jgi:hypothetical protein